MARKFKLSFRTGLNGGGVLKFDVLPYKEILKRRIFYIRASAETARPPKKPDENYFTPSRYFPHGVKRDPTITLSQGLGRTKIA